ncbi:hypothetical protein ACV334_34570, partial [Pseudomonas aeruginosa]
GPAIDLTWQEGFQTDRRAEVVAYCRQTCTHWTWLDAQRLNTRQVRPAMVRPPLSGETLWFNHAHMFPCLQHAADLVEHGPGQGRRHVGDMGTCARG